MWGLWFFPVVVLMFLVGTALALVWFVFGPSSWRSRAGAVALPFGCAAIPIVGFMLLAALAPLTQTGDTQLYEEVFGYRPTITEDRLLFDDFGRGNVREIFMRAQPTDAERRTMLAIPGAVESDSTLNRFIGRGGQHGFGWWISSDCRSARILDASGFNGWIEFQLAECLDAGTEFPASETVGEVYVVASGRRDD